MPYVQVGAAGIKEKQDVKIGYDHFPSHSIQFIIVECEPLDSNILG
jgi:hypothetical protein